MLYIADSVKKNTLLSTVRVYQEKDRPCISRKGPFSMTKLKAGISATYPPTQLLTISRKELHHF